MIETNYLVTFDTYNYQSDYMRLLWLTRDYKELTRTPSESLFTHKFLLTGSELSIFKALFKNIIGFELSEGHIKIIRSIMPSSPNFENSDIAQLCRQ